MSEMLDERPIKADEQRSIDDAVLHCCAAVDGDKKNSSACAGTIVEKKTPASTVAADEEPEVPPKRRKTRRGKSKRRHPYNRKNGDSKSNYINAPYNSNRFLIEDHQNLDGFIEEEFKKNIEAEFKKNDQASISTVTRTRDSSISMDSDAEFYSTPDEEDVFMIKDFDVEYESLQAERLNAMPKEELIREFLNLESKVELLTRRLGTAKKNGFFGDNDNEDNGYDSNVEIDKLKIEIEALRRENEALRAASLDSSSSDSADTETDSSDSCSSSSSDDDEKKHESKSRSQSPVDYHLTNGHTEPDPPENSSIEQSA